MLLLPTGTSLHALLPLFLYVLAQFVSTTTGTETGTSGGGSGRKGVKTMMDERRDKQYFKERMQKDVAITQHQQYNSYYGNAKQTQLNLVPGRIIEKVENIKLTEKAREVQIDLMACLFPEPAVEEKGRDVQKLEDRIKDIFEDNLFDSALPDMIQRRIDQLAQRPYMEERAKQLDKANFADSNKEEKSSLNSRFTNLLIVTKNRLFFYRWLVKLIERLDFRGNKRIEVYRTDSKANKHVPGQAFELHLADWLQNRVVNPLGQQIILDLIEQQQQRSWEVVLPFCVHMSLRAFLDYADRLDLNYRFRLDKLFESDVKASVVENVLLEVTENLTKKRKTAKELVKTIYDEIFANLSLPDDFLPMKSGIGQALQNAINGLGEEAENKRGDQQVLHQFFVRFYEELGKLTVPKWLQRLMKRNSAKMEEKGEELQAEGMVKPPTEHLKKFHTSHPEHLVEGSATAAGTSLNKSNKRKFGDTDGIGSEYSEKEQQNQQSYSSPDHHGHQVQGDSSLFGQKQEQTLGVEPEPMMK